ncbi:chloride channel [Aureococcus anophagefferens]|nr:chloride channel [Aureococcus anophagefferens]
MPDDDQETYTRLDGGQPEGAGRESEAASLWSAFHWQLARSGREVAVADDAPAPFRRRRTAGGRSTTTTSSATCPSRRGGGGAAAASRGLQRRTLARWVVTCAIGCSMGVVAIALAQLTDVLVEWRNGRVAPRERSGFAAFVGLNAVLALAAAGAAVGCAPGAEASGIPVVKAYLNGVRMRGCLSVPLRREVFGTAPPWAPASLGPEGPSSTSAPSSRRVAGAATPVAFYGAARASSAWACVRASPDVAAWTVDDKFARRFDCAPGHVHELASLWFGSSAIKKILEAGAGELRGGGLLLSGVLTLATLALVFGNALPGGLFLPLIFARRSTVSLVVIILEGTGNQHLLIPIIVATVCARGAGNFLSEGLYELALELKHVPFLEKHVHAGLDARPVADLVVGRPVVSLPRVARASDARRVLKHTAHGATSALLRHGPGLDDSARGAFPPDLATRLATSSYDAGVSVRSRSAGDGAPAARFFPEHPLGRDSDDAPGTRESSADTGPDHDLDLAPIMVRSPHVVYDDCPVSRAYRLFVTMGLRHLVVVDHRDNGVVGILTRKDRREASLVKGSSAASLEENKSPFEMPEDDGDTFRDIGVALGKSVVLLFVLTACAASAFQAIETPKELSRAMHARVTLAGMRAKYNITKSDYADIVDALAVPTPRCGRCNRADLDSKCTSKLKHCNWNWIGSFYFAFTIFTTIGYGTFTPATAGGKVLVVIIFFPGVIALGYFMAGIARLNRKVHHDLASIGEKARGVPPSLFLPLTPPSAGDTKAFQGCMCMFVFALPFLFVLAYGYHASEEMGWTLGNGCYYAFVTLSTIGFGDYSIRDVTLWEVLFILIGVGIIAMAIGVTTDLIESNMAAAKEAAPRR